MSNLNYKVAYDLLEEMILTLKLEPKKIYLEKELSEMIEIGRTPTREALICLQKNRLANIIPRRGVEITDIDISGHLSLLETRRVLDVIIIENASKFASKEAKSVLSNLKDDILKASLDNDVNEYFKIDFNFDEIVYKESRNEYASMATRPLHSHCRRFWYKYKSSDDLSSSAKLHSLMMEGIIEGDELKSIKASNDWIDSSITFTKNVINGTA